MQIKFADKNLYYIEKSKGDWTVSNSSNSTTICFIAITDDFLNDCQYHSEKCRGWSGEIIAGNAHKFGTFNQENINRLDAILETPIKNGWIAIDYYLFNRYYKSKTYPDKDLTKKPFLNFSSRIGCLQILFFPFMIILNIFINRGLIGRNEKIIVEPIITRQYKPKDKVS